MTAAHEVVRATPPDPNWKWYNGLEAADPQRQPLTPTLIETAGLQAFARLEDLAAALAQRLASRRPILKRTVATYDGYDSFPAFSVYAQAEGATATAAALWIGCAAVQKTRAEDLEAAIAAAQQLSRAA